MSVRALSILTAILTGFATSAAGVLIFTHNANAPAANVGQSIERKEEKDPEETRIRQVKEAVAEELRTKSEPVQTLYDNALPPDAKDSITTRLDPNMRVDVYERNGQKGFVIVTRKGDTEYYEGHGPYAEDYTYSSSLVPSDILNIKPE